MKAIKYLFFGTLICLTIMSCNKNNSNLETIKVTGIIQEQGITTYQYGSHTIAGYAIRCSTIVLDDYIGQNVTIEGTKIDGYPIDGGPVFLEVIKIK